MTEQNEQELAELTELYGPAAAFSEHKRGEHIRYISAEGIEQSGVIVWVQARFENIPMKYVIAPDQEGAFLDFAMPADVLG